MRAGLVLLIYATLLLLGGFIAFAMAPEGANAMTALIVPAVCAVLLDICGMSVILGWKLGKRALVMFGAHAGMLLATLFTVAFAVQGWSRLGQSNEYREAVAAYQADNGAPEGLAAHLSALDLPAYDTRYLATILLGLAALSVVALIAMVLCRPKPSDRGA